jgi:hypothetical protein
MKINKPLDFLLLNDNMKLCSICCINSVKVDSKKRSKVNSKKEVFRIV